MKKQIIRTIFTTGALAMLTACQKEAAYLQTTADKELATVYLQQAITFPQVLTTFPFTDEPRSFSLNAGFGAVKNPASNIAIKLAVDTKALDSLNTVRQLTGQALYLPFPADAYTIGGLDLTIPGGKLTSNSITVNYFPKKFDPAKSYMLPISIADASGYTVNAKVKTVFLEVGKLAGKPAAKTGWTATASSEELGGEGPVNGRAGCVIDNNLSTFWHSTWSVSPNPPFPHWIIIDMKAAMTVDKVEIAPRHNNSNGVTKFNLESSKDGTTWTLLAENLVLDPANKTLQPFAVTPTEMKFLKVIMTEGRSGPSTHLGEVGVYKY